MQEFAIGQGAIGDEGRVAREHRPARAVRQALLLIGHPVQVLPGRRALQEVRGLAAGRIDQRPIGPVEQDRRAGTLAEGRGEAGVIGVAVGQDDQRQILHPRAEVGQRALDHREGLGHLPGGVDQDRPGRPLDQVDIHAAERAIAEGDGDTMDTGQGAGGG